jgi:hypothetical protein
MSTTPKERPILFNTQMIKAILAGRKTQTRRVVKLDGFSTITHEAIFNLPQQTQYLYLGKDDQTISVSEDCIDSICPYGRIGDILWVRETFQLIQEAGCDVPVYKASQNGQDWQNNSEGWTWKPSIFMPKWASRISLRITSVRIEPLHQISAADVRAEGIGNSVFHLDGRILDPRQNYFALWREINGIESYEKNPWVWVVEFKVLSTQANFCNPINPNTNAAH